MPLPEPSLLFARFEQDAGTRGGARTHFQLLVTDLVKVLHPDATTVEGPGGRDWGLDTFVGQLAGGRIAVWQSKFVLDWTDNGPQGQIRESFQSAIAMAAAKGHSLDSWTLVVPCAPSPEQRRWFDGWARRQHTATGVPIRIWDGSELRHQLMRTDAEHVRREYFPHTLPHRPALAPQYERVAVTDDLSAFSEALFVKQLHAAGRTRTDAARALYYATDVLVRDFFAKGIPESIAALDELHLNVLEIWERHYNNEAPGASAEGRMPRLHDLVLESVGACDDPPGLYLRPAHRKGTAHRLVEQARAGWVTHWEEIAREHGSSRSVPTSAQAGQPNADQTVTFSAPARPLPGQEPEVAHAIDGGDRV